MADAPSSIDFLEPARQDGELGRLGPYRVLETIGSGGMGRVFLAEDTRLRRPVALKVMNEKFAATPNSRKRFLEEARAMAAVDNDNVVRIYEVGERNKTPFMAMELLKGATLTPAAVGGERPDYQKMIRLARQVCHGLATAHQRDIIHRDIKPGNIWIEASSGRAKILDFGLALATGPMGQLAGRGSVVGTPGYLSPEQARNESLDDRSDLYSLGVVLFELCTGQLPFQAKSIPLMLVSIITHPTPKVRELNPEVPVPLADLIDRCLAKEARDRPASATALEAELAAVGEAIESESHAALQIVTAAPSAASRSTTTVTAQRPGPSVPAGWQKSPWLWAGGAGGLVLLALIVGVSVWGTSDPAPRPAAVVAPPSPTVNKRSITPQSLAPLQLQGLTASETEVGSGDVATLKFNLVNQAVGRDDNPARIHASESTVAVCRLFLQPVDGVRRDGYALPLRRRPSQLPQPGKSSPLTIRFATDSIPLGEYTAIVSLQTPKQAVVSEVETAIRIVPNLGKGELLGYERVRTWAGEGADTSVGEKAAADAGEAKQLTIAGVADQPPAQQQHIYLRFDLSRWEQPRERLQHAVLLLTLLDKSPAAPFELRAYAADESLPSDWQESGENRLVWSAAPSATNLGKLQFLGTIRADNTGDLLKNQGDAVRLFGPELDEAVRRADKLLTIVLVRSSGPNGPLLFVSKESDPEKAPALALRAEP